MFYAKLPKNCPKIAQKVGRGFILSGKDEEKSQISNNKIQRL
jgi:hypothetical protein